MTKEKDENDFIEKFGLFLEKNSSFPRIAGRIYGFLLISSPPHQSANHLVQRLQITKGSVSTMIRVLLQSKLVEEISLPSERSRYYRVKEGAWSDLFIGNLQGLISARELLGEGLQLLNKKEDKKRIQEIDELYAFFEKKMPQIINEWENAKRQKNEY